MDMVRGCIQEFPPAPPMTGEDGLITLEMAEMAGRAVRNCRGLVRDTKKGVVLCPVSCGGDNMAGGGDQYPENMENDVTAGVGDAGANHGDRRREQMDLGWPDMGWNFDHTYSMADMSSSSESESSPGCTWGSRSTEVEEEVDKEDAEQAGLTRQVVDSWNIVKKKSYIMFKAVQSPSLSSGQFWEEDFVQKVFDAVRDDLVSVSGAAELLGANYSEVYYHYKKRGQVIPRSCDRRKLGLNTRMVLKPDVVNLGFDRDEELANLDSGKSEVDHALVHEETLYRLEEESPKNNEDIAPCKEVELMEALSEMRAPLCQSPNSLINEGGIMVEEASKHVPGVIWDEEEDFTTIADDDVIKLKEESNDPPSPFDKADTDLAESKSYLQHDKLESSRKKTNLTLEGLARWTDFILFSSLVIPNVKDKVNPYKASIQDVKKFLSLYEQLYHWDWRTMSDYVETLSDYLPWLCLEDLVTVAVDKVVLDNLAKTVTAAPHKVTWSKFVDFCSKYSSKTEHIVNPFLAKPDLVRDFLISKFKGKELMGNPKDNIFKPSRNFYTDNLTRICPELDWYLKTSHSGKPLLESKKMKCLVVAARNREAGVLTDKLALRLTPDYHFCKYSLAGVPDAFWTSQLTQDVLTDVKNGLMEREVAAKELGVTEEMVSSSIRAAEVNREETFSLRQYVRQGFGSRDSFWKEESTVKMMLDVRNRKTSVEALAAQFGVSRRRIVEKCGGVKEQEVVEEESQKNRIAEKFDKNSVKQKSDLEKQIESAEKRFDSLSEYEKMRLSNMKERQKMVEMLNLNEDKAVLMIKTPGRVNKVKVKKVKLSSRERSSRLKRISETRVLRQNKENIDPDWSQGGKVRLSPRWFGQWIPQQQSLKKCNGDDLETSSLPVPPVDLKMAELLDLSNKYHTGMAMVDSISSEVRNLSVEIKWEDKVSFDKFEVEHDCVISSNSLTCIDSHHDLICYGTSAGGVGLFLSGRSVTIRPHNLAVSRTIFWGGHSSLGVLSAGHDGAVRLTDLAKQMVSMEYTWDKTTSTKHKVYWMEEENHNSLLLHCGQEVNRLDMREKEANSVISLPDWSMDDMSTLGTNLSIHPMQSTMVSLSTKAGVQIWDLRNPTQPARLITPSRSSQPHQVRHTACGASWSPSTGQYLMVAQRITVEYNKYSLTRSDIPTVYRKDDYSHPLLSWQRARSVSFSPMYGVNWCPWDQEESAFLTTAKMEPTIGQRHSEPQYQVVAVNGVSGQVVGKLGRALDNTCYLVHCHNTRQVVIVGNNKGDGGLAVLKANAK